MAAPPQPKPRPPRPRAEAPDGANTTAEPTSAAMMRSILRYIGFLLGLPVTQVAPGAFVPTATRSVACVLLAVPGLRFFTVVDKFANMPIYAFDPPDLVAESRPQGVREIS